MDMSLIFRNFAKNYIMKRLLIIFISIISIFSCFAADPIKIFESDSERMYFYPDQSNAFNYNDGRSGYTVFIRRIWTVPQNGAKSIDLELEFNSNWTKVRIMKWFENDIHNQLRQWETNNPGQWQNVINGTVGGNVRDGVRKYF